MTTEQTIAALMARARECANKNANAANWLGLESALREALPPEPTMTAEEARAGQQWAGMDGATAFLLIERHADGWADTWMMMRAWLEANREALAPPGFVMVPLELTEEMIAAALGGVVLEPKIAPIWRKGLLGNYRAMLSARPAAPGEVKETT